MRSSLTLALCSLLFQLHGSAQQWMLDPDFADAGRLVIDVDQSIDELSAMVVRTDGKTLVAGWATPMSGNFSGAVLAQIGPDGQLDVAFGDLGIAATYLPDRSVFAYAMAEQPDHAVVLAGGSLSTTFVRDAIVLRYLADGTRDPDFGVDSMVTADLGGNEVFTAVAINAIGQIICAGRVGGSILVMRYEQNGVLDPLFGIGGITEVPLGLGNLSGHVGMGLRSDGKVALAYTTVDGLVLARLEEDGVPDNTFGTDGVLMNNEELAFHAFLLQPDDFMLVGGGAPLDVNEECQGFQLMRFDPDGVLDPAFDGDGIVRTLVSQACPELYGLALLPGGLILAAGTGSTEDTFADLTAVRYRPDGSLDPAFDEDGMIFVDMGCSAMDVAYAIAPQTDGDVMVSGLTDCGPFPNDIAVIRLQPDINTAIGDPLASTVGLSLRPNPALHETWLEYTIATDQPVSLELWDVQGRKVSSVLAQQRRTIGTHREQLSLHGLSAGLYTAVLSRGGVVERARFVKE